MPDTLKEVVCWEVPGSIPEPLLTRITAVLEARGELDAARCEYTSRGTTVEEVLEDVTNHLAEAHGLKSFVPEFWVHIRKCIRDVSA